MNKSPQVIKNVNQLKTGKTEGLVSILSLTLNNHRYEGLRIYKKINDIPSEKSISSQSEFTNRLESV
jgi:hypothetical protein